jgi:hypothetical protein
MTSRQHWIAAAALGAAAAVVTSSPRAARGDNITWTGAGDGVSWTDPNNWENDTTMLPGVPTNTDQGFINNVASVTINSTVSVGTFSIGHGTGTATLSILPGADFTVNGTSRIGRGTGTISEATGVVRQTGGTVTFPGGHRLGLTFDSRTLPEINADSLYEISAGTFQMTTTGSIQIGRTLNSGGVPIEFGRAEFRVVGSAPALVTANRISMDGGGTTGTPVLGFVIDSGGVTKITLRDWLRLNQGATLDVTVNASSVPATELTLLECDFFTTGALTEFVDRPEGSTVSDISNNRLFEWTLRYNNATDDGVIDSWVKLTEPRSFRGGDANKDGTVNLSDFNILASNFGATGAGWTQADFNGDGNVNLGDFNVLAGNFGLSGAASGPTAQDWATLGAAIPEPTMVGVLALAVAALPRRRRSQRGVR